MEGPLVATKLFVPKMRRGLVGRPRLSARLSRGAESKLTLVSAPAGFGKTTLVAEWLASTSHGGGSVAWLSLDPADNEPTAFWSHVIAALQGAGVGIGATILQRMQSEQQPVQVILALLLNELSALPSEVGLVLDDYHLVDHPDIHSEMAFLLEHLPSNSHVLISTRADPALPLARLRAQGELVEVRSVDLRFMPDEAATYLNDVMGLSLSPEEVAALEGRTEGWIAALQLAALSIQGRDDPTSFIAGFTGNDRYIVDYLVEEVLRRQPEAVRHFLGRTCFLGRLNGSLCDAVVGGVGSGKMLDQLDRQNLFVVPLDDRRRWYRYHHLFADVLLTHFGDDVRPDLPALHRRACDWYERHGERSEAIRHALAGHDFERAAELIELALPAQRKNRGVATLRGWFAELPDTLIRDRPVLGIGYVGVLVASGEFEGVETRLADAERCLARLAETGAGPLEASAETVAYAEADQLRPLPGTIELYRAALAQVRGDVPGTIRHAQRVLDLAPPDDHLGRAGGAGFLGIALWASGELDAAHRWWTECTDLLHRAGHMTDAIGAAIALADVQLVQGRLHAATRTYEHELLLVDDRSSAPLLGTADLHTGLGAVSRERNDLQAARRHLLKSQELGDESGVLQNPCRWRVAMAQLRQAEGDPEGALVVLDEAERHHVPDLFPNVRPVAAIKARVLISQEQLDGAMRWASEAGVSAGDELSYLREFEHITLARLLLAQHTRNQAGSFGGDALGLLDRLLTAAERGGRLASVIEISVLQALASSGRGDTAASMVPLERALTLAETEEYVRLFLDEGEPMAALLKATIRRGTAPAYARKLLAAAGTPGRNTGVIHPDLIEPLSERELDVLHLLRSDLDGPEIARELGVSLNTMRTHTKNIYDKLGVNSRRSALRRAEELSLLQRSHRR